MDLADLAAVGYLAATIVIVAFQLGLAAGAPWGELAMGGRWPGRFPPPMRLAAIVQAVVLSLLAMVVLSAAGLAWQGIADGLPWLIWAVVALAVVSVLMNAASRSPRERRLWVPVGLVLLITSLVVALTG